MKYPEAWAALDVGFDGHDYQVWSLAEILEKLDPRLAALEDLKQQRGQFDPFRGRTSRRRVVAVGTCEEDLTAPERFGEGESLFEPFTLAFSAGRLARTCSS